MPIDTGPLIPIERFPYVITCPKERTSNHFSQKPRSTSSSELFLLKTDSYRSCKELKPSSVRSRDFTNISRSEEHTSELQSRFDLVCRLLLEKKKNNLYMNDKV